VGVPLAAGFLGAAQGQMQGSDAAEKVGISGSWQGTMRAPDGHAVAHISQQRLADAVGTAREVVTRELRTLRALGVIDTRPERVIVVDEERLARIAAG